jgi:predicted dehydrogenase
MKAAVIGCGYWGRHLIRNFYNSRVWELKYICDFKQENIDKYLEMYPGVTGTKKIDTVVNDAEIDAVVIATPVFDHYESAKKALLAGKHVWLEKPLTTTSAQAEELCKIAEDNNLILHVDHTFIYTPAVQKIKELVDKGELGDMLYFDSVRINLGLFQHDVNVIWDLAPHDISILEYTVGKKPVSVQATGASPYKYGDNEIESIAYMTVRFEDDTIAHFHANWLSPVKIRQIIMGGSKKMLVFNDMEPAEKIKIYDSGVEFKNDEDIYNALISYRTGDSYSPTLDNYEALSSECDHFFECVKDGKETRTPGRSGLYVVKILEAANESLKTGRAVEIKA